MVARKAVIEVLGYHNEPLIHKYLRQEPATDHLGFLLPGRAYGLTLPVLHFPGQLLRELGYDTFGLETRYAAADFSAAPEPEQLAWLRADVLGAYRAVNRTGQYQKVSVVAKSLGTVGLCLLLETGELPEASSLVWLTPLLSRPEVVRVIRRYASDSLVVIGTHDPEYDPEVIQILEQQGATVLVLPQTDHSLDVEDDTLASLENLKSVLGAIRHFLR